MNYVLLIFNMYFIYRNIQNAFNTVLPKWVRILSLVGAACSAVGAGCAFSLIVGWL